MRRYRAELSPVSNEGLWLLLKTNGESTGGFQQDDKIGFSKRKNHFR